MMPLLDKTAEFFKSTDLMSDDYRSQTVQEQFSSLLSRLKEGKEGKEEG